MYRLLKPLSYEWSVVRVNSFVNPYFDLDLRNKIRVRFIDLLDEDGKSYGIWTGHQVSQMLLSHLCRTIQASEIDWEYLEDNQTWGMHFD